MVFLGDKRGLRALKAAPARPGEERASPKAGARTDINICAGAIIMCARARAAGGYLILSFFFKILVSFASLESLSAVRQWRAASRRLPSLR